MPAGWCQVTAGGFAFAERGVARGQARPGAADPLLAEVAPALVMQHFLAGDTPATTEQLTLIVDRVVMPLVAPTLASGRHTGEQ